MQMTFEEAREKLKAVDIRPMLTPSKGGLYQCPFCGSGTHANGTGAAKYYPDSNKLFCHACKNDKLDGRSADAIDVYQYTTGAAGHTAAVFEMADSNGIEIIDDDHPRPGQTRKEPPKIDFTKSSNELPAANNKEPQSAQEPPTEANFFEYYSECSKRITDPAAVSYLQGRGISIETAQSMFLGFDPQADPACNPGGSGQTIHPAARIIVPVTPDFYVTRAIDANIAPKYRKMNSKGGGAGITQETYLRSSAQAVFVFEGWADAASAIEGGGAAIALNSTSNVDLLLKQLESSPTDATLILCLDSDDAGQAAQEKLKQGLRRLNVPFIVGDINGGYKDANEHLTADRKGFFDAVQTAQRQTAAKPDNVSLYIDTLFADEIEAFKSDIKTGFSNLDRESGGLYAGLYVLAAVSSLGKTTFAHQMADQIAAAGNDVLYFSLEQSRLEMVSKSIARITAQEDLKTAVTSLDIRKKRLTANTIAAAEQYKETVADRMNIIEGNFACDLPFIGDYIRRYIQRNGAKPVVVIDYLQILKPQKDKIGRTASTKETVDETMTELKRLSREQGLTIIAISSVNRANYLTPVDFESLKESGNIEYTADVVWGLQLHCLENDDLFRSQSDIIAKRAKVKEEKARNPRLIDLVCLKNRYGIANYTCWFEYYPVNDVFRPIAKPDDDGSTAPQKGKRGGKK